MELSVDLRIVGKRTYKPSDIETSYDAKSGYCRLYIKGVVLKDLAGEHSKRASDTASSSSSSSSATTSGVSTAATTATASSLPLESKQQATLFAKFRTGLKRLVSKSDVTAPAAERISRK